MRMGQDLLVTLQGDLDDRTVESIEREITDQVARLRRLRDKHEPVDQP